MVSQHYRASVFIAVFLLAAVYFFVFSETGFLERLNLEKERKSIIANIETMKSENERLHRLLKKYRAGAYTEKDLQNSGYIKEGGTILYFSGIEGKHQHYDVKPTQSASFPVPLPYLRIGWIGISALIVILLIFYGSRLREQAE